MKTLVFCASLIFAPLLTVHGEAGDTVLTFQAARQRLMNYNLKLLAAHYEIGIAQAKLIQARVWNNPNFILNGDMYNQETNEYFALRNQSLWQLEQTFSWAGKHTNTVRLARIGIEMAEKQLEDVIRSILYELGITYTDVAALQAKQKLYTQVIASYDQLLQATKKQLEVGAISSTEAVRLEAEYLDVKAEAIENYNNLESAQAQLRTMLRIPHDSAFVVEQKIPIVAEEFDPGYLAVQAAENRPDVMLSKINVRYEEQNLKLQRSTGYPDIKFGFQPYDRGSNYVRPYHGFTTELFLPIYDRNQGRIKQAKLTSKQAALESQHTEIQAKNEVYASYNRYVNSKAGLENYDTEFIQRLNDLNVGSNQNFKKRNISLLQFIDQQRIYILTNIQFIELKKQFLDTVNELNFSVGQTIIDY